MIRRERLFANVEGSFVVFLIGMAGAALAELARRKPYIVRFIEFMPLDADRAWSADQVLTGGEIRTLLLH